jgi:integrase
MQVVEVDNFMDSLRSPSTKELYAAHRKQFLDFIGRKSINEDSAAEATQEIIQYLKKLKDDGLSYSYRHTALAAIKHDYLMHNDNNLVLNWKKIAKFLGENERKYEIRGYTQDEIRRLMDVADIKYRAVILLLASTGMRRDALVKIESKDMEYLNDYNLYQIRIYKKSKFQQICFTTPEAAEAIKLYVNTRPGAKYFHNVNNKAISMALGKLATKAGIIKKGNLGYGKDHRNEVPAVHGLRKFCITQMARAKVDTEIAKLLTGHSIGVRGRYLNYSEDDLLQEYLKALDLLTINETNRLRKKVDILKEKEDEIKRLTERLESYESQISQLTDSQKEILDFMDRNKQELEHTRKMVFMLGAHAEGKKMRYNEVPTREEAMNNPEFKEWCKKNKKKLGYFDQPRIKKS